MLMSPEFNAKDLREMLNLKVPPKICSRSHFQILHLLSGTKEGLRFHVNHLLADDSHEVSSLPFPEYQEMNDKMYRLLQL